MQDYLKHFFSEPLSEEVLINRIHMGQSNCTNKVITYMFVQLVQWHLWMCRTYNNCTMISAYIVDQFIKTTVLKQDFGFSS